MIVLKCLDFNDEGVDDRLECIRERGVTCDFIDGSTNETISWRDFHWAGAIKTVITIPKKLLLKKNRRVFQTMRSAILPQAKKAPDTSLQWIISASYNKKRLTDNHYFDLLLSPQTKWGDSGFRIPSSYYVQMSRDSLYRLDASLQKDAMNTVATAKFGFLAYYGNVHFKGEEHNDEKFIQTAKDSIYTIYKTAHGVIAQKKNKFKWLFITDYDLTGGPEKLRWASIEAVYLLDDHVLVKQKRTPDPEYQLFIINIETAVVGRIKVTYDILLEHDIEFLNLNASERFSIKDNVVTIGNEVKKIRLRIADIKKNLAVFSQPE